MVNHPLAAKKTLVSLDAVTSAANMRSIHRGALTHCLGLCVLISPYGHYRRLLLALPLCDSHSFTFLPPVPRRCFATSASRGLAFGLGRCGTMKALTPAPLHPRCRSPRLLRHTFLSFYLQPRGLPGHRLPPRQRDPRVSDFAMNEQARRSSPPNRVRYPTDRQFASGCSPRRFGPTQLPSASEFVASSDTDLHCADVAPSRAHSFPRTRESRFVLCRISLDTRPSTLLRTGFRGYDGTSRLVRSADHPRTGIFEGGTKDTKDSDDSAQRRGS